MTRKNIVPRFAFPSLGATLAVAVAAGAAWLSRSWLPHETLSLFFLLPIVFCAARYRLLYSLYAVILSFVAYNFFFIEPIFTLSVYSRADIATLLFFPVVALLTANIAMRLKMKLDRLETAAERDAALREVNNMAEREKLRSALLSSLSHDLRTPLVSIIGSASTLQEVGAALPAASRDSLLGTIVGEAERLNRFIQNLLDMTRLGQGGLLPRRNWTDFRDILGGALKRTQNETRAHYIAVQSGQAPALLFIDPVLMKQVFVNIIDNAAKYTPAGTHISISFKADQGGSRIIFRDQGPGIPAADRELVFEMFYRLPDRDRQTAGTGLGLAICRGLVEAQGGRIHVAEPENGPGTEIVISFPPQGKPP